MRRTGYFATVSGARGTGQRPLLRPPRRLFAPEAVAPGFGVPERVDAPPAAAAPASEQPFSAGRDESAEAPPRATPASVVAEPVDERVAQPDPEPVRPAPPRAAVVRTTTATVARPSVVRDPHTSVAEPAPRPRAGARPTRAARPEPLLPPPAARTPRRTVRADRRAPELRIGAIEVTVVPPPAPAAQPVQRPVAAAPRPRPLRGPDVAAPWYGLAQR